MKMTRAFEYLRAFRELYEAFAIASFVYYIIELLGGEENLALALRTKNGSYGSHVFVFKLVCKEWNMGREFMMNCKYGVVCCCDSILCSCFLSIC